MRESKGEGGKRGKREVNRDGLVSCVAMATEARKQQEFLFPCLSLVFLARATMIQDVTSGLVSLVSVSANNRPGSLQAALVRENVDTRQLEAGSLDI